MDFTWNIAWVVPEIVRLLTVHRILRRFQIGRKVFARLMVNRTSIAHAINLMPSTAYSYLHHRVKWIEARRRVNLSGSQVKVRVCSVHLVDGVPTEQKPYPTLQLGYVFFNSSESVKYAVLEGYKKAHLSLTGKESLQGHLERFRRIKMNFF